MVETYLQASELYFEGVSAKRVWAFFGKSEGTEQRTKTDRHFGYLWPSQNPRWECFLNCSSVFRYEQHNLWAHLKCNSFDHELKTKREEKETDSFLVENHTKYIGLSPPRPFSAYQTICASDLFPWQCNLEVVFRCTVTVISDGFSILLWGKILAVAHFQVHTVCTCM